MFHPTTHLKDLMVQRGISRKDILNDIFRGVKRIKGDVIVSLVNGMEIMFVKRSREYFVFDMRYR